MQIPYDAPIGMNSEHDENAEANRGLNLENPDTRIDSKALVNSLPLPESMASKNHGNAITMQILLTKKLSIRCGIHEASYFIVRYTNTKQSQRILSDDTISSTRCFRHQLVSNSIKIS